MSTLKRAPGTVILVAINVIVFFGLTLFGMTEDPSYMLEHGAMYVPYVLEQHEYYRMITSMFLHFGFDHLMGNMVMLSLLGWLLEQELGTVKYLILYLASGLGGEATMIWHDIYLSDYVPSAGASGAIFGVIGGLLWVAIRNQGHVGSVSGGGLLAMLAVSLYYGFTSTGIANAAHVGGLVAGFVLCILLYRRRRYHSRLKPV